MRHGSLHIVVCQNARYALEVDQLGPLILMELVTGFGRCGDELFLAEDGCVQGSNLSPAVV